MELGKTLLLAIGGFAGIAFVLGLMFLSAQSMAMDRLRFDQEVEFAKKTGGVLGSRHTVHYPDGRVIFLDTYTR